MSTVKISALPEATAINPEDIHVIVQGGVTKQLSNDLIGGTRNIMTLPPIESSQTVSDDDDTPSIATQEVITVANLNAAAANTAGKTYTDIRIPIIATYENNILIGGAAAMGPSDGDDHDFCVRTSTDGGDTWTDISFPLGQEVSNNYISTHPLVTSLGRIYVFAFAYAEPGHTVLDTRIAWTDDYGVNWLASGGAVSGWADMDSIGSLATGNRIVATNNGIEVYNGQYKGRLVMPCDASYVNDGFLPYRSFVVYSDDSGTTWKIGNPTPLMPDEFEGMTAGMVEPSLFERQDGVLVMVMRGQVSDNKIEYISYSFDGGINWTYPTAYWQSQHSAVLMSPTTMLSGLSGGIPRLVKTHPIGPSSYSNLEIMLSYDHGISYSHKKTIWTDKVRYSAVAPLPNNYIAVSFEGGYVEEKEFIGFIKLNIAKIRE